MICGARTLGSALAFQAKEAGSIPVRRSIASNRPWWRGRSVKPDALGSIPRLAAISTGVFW